MNQNYAVVIEKAGENFSAWVPDLPGCVATAATRGAVIEEIRRAIQFHLAGLAADSQQPPPPSSSVEMVAV